MTDRELLEAAAKAADMPSYGWWWVDGVLCKAGDKRTPWNPLTDDGDALRLAVRLGMEVLPQEPLGVLCVVRGISQARAKEPFGEDRSAATRRAIVRAAAAMAG